jgi:conjugative transfer ATPase
MWTPFKRNGDAKDDSGPGMTTATRKRMASRPPSFTDALPWTAFDPEDEVFILNDGISLGAFFELTPTPTEAMPDDILQDRAEKVLAALKAIPEETEGEWILQFYCYDDIAINTLVHYLDDYIRESHKDDPKRMHEILDSKFTRNMLSEMALHFATVSRTEGLFEDTVVSSNIWRGQQRRVYLVLYRKFPPNFKPGLNTASPFESITSACEGVVAALREAEVGIRRANGKDFYEFMTVFMNRRQGLHPSALLREAPYPGDAPKGDPVDAAPISYDLAELVTLSQPESDTNIGAYRFGDTLVKALTLQQITKQPEIGHFTAERKMGEKHFARFDRLPAGSMLSMTISAKPQHRIREYVERIQTNSRAKTPEAEQTWNECRRCLQRMAYGDKLFPFFMTLYIAGQTPEELRQKTADVTSRLTPSGLRFINPGDDLTPLDAFIRALPMCYDSAFDAKVMKRSRLVFASQIANMLPIYGRHRGSGNPGMPFWNRGGEPLWIDPLNNRDRRKNGHMLTFGPTGAGKSATLNFLSMMVMAIYRARLVIVDAGESFGLLVQYFKEQGLSTHVIKLNHQSQVSLPPFVLAPKLLEDSTIMSAFAAAEKVAVEEGRTGRTDDVTEAEGRKAIDELSRTDDDASPTATEPDAAEGGDDSATASNSEERRDILGEMLISAIMMITGGEEREVQKLGRADRYLITRAIIRATIAARNDGKPHPLVHDVALQMTRMRSDESLSPARSERAEYMGQAMLAFTDGLRGKLFNRAGESWPDADVTLVEMGVLTQDGYEDALALAYTGLIDHVQGIGEATQHDGRHTVFLTDEGHLITTNPLLGPKVAKGTKMWRKLQIWFWLATQNMKDFPDAMSRVLSMCEWWLLLTMEKAEVEEIARFKTLTREQRLMVESARKEPGKFTEGVILSAGAQMLFRNVPPPLAIALAMTEGHEKAERKRIMDEHNCSEMEAAVHVARRIAKRPLMLSNDMAAKKAARLQEEARRGAATHA